MVMTLREAVKDEEVALDLFRKWYIHYVDATRYGRAWSKLCRRYYDSRQWTLSELVQLEGRDPITVNMIFKKINSLVGYEIDTRTDPVAKPRPLDSQAPNHKMEAEAITDALRYLMDKEDGETEGADEVFTAVWENMLIEGFGGRILETEVVQGITGDEDVEIALVHQPWDTLWYDPHSRRSDFGDAKYTGFSKWADLDDHYDYYEAMEAMDERDETEDASLHPEWRANLEAALEHSSQDGGYDEDAQQDRPDNLWSDRRDRVLVNVVYFKIGRDFYTAHYTVSGFIVPPRKTGYLDDRGRHFCPLSMESAFVSGQGEVGTSEEDNMRYGLVLHLLSPQDELNHHRTKGVWWMSLDRTIYEKNVIDDIVEFQTQRGRPDGAIEVEEDALAEGRITTQSGTEKASLELQVSETARTDILATGPDTSSLAQAPAASGRELALRERIGNMELAKPKGNHRRFKRKAFRQMWWAVRQFKTGEWWARVTDDSEKTGHRFVGLNRPMTKAQRFMELLEMKVPPQSALDAVHVPPEVFQQATQAIVQQAQMMQQQTGQQIDQAQLTQAVIGQVVAYLNSLPREEQIITANDTSKLTVDIIIDEQRDVATLEDEAFRDLSQNLPAFLQAKPEKADKFMTLLLELSPFRYRKKAIALLEDDPVDPAQQQVAAAMQQAQIQAVQLQNQKLAADVKLAEAKAQEAAAKAQQTTVETQLEPARAEAEIIKNRAQASVQRRGQIRDWLQGAA